ncbi:hypothetical protein [Pragia fontium]
MGFFSVQAIPVSVEQGKLVIQRELIFRIIYTCTCLLLITKK